MGRTTSWNHRFGAAAERHACGFLQAQGVTVVRRRYRVAGGEIDIVARHHEWLILIEVKARTGASYGAPAEAVGWRKQRRIVTASRHLLAEMGGFDSVRFDVIEVRTIAGRAEVSWIQDAFRP